MKRTAIGQPLFLGLMVAAGVGIVWAVVVSWCVMMAEQWPRSGTLCRNIQVRRDGTPLIRSWRPRDYHNATYRDLDGRKVSVPSAEQELSGTSLAGARPRRSRWGGLQWRQRILWLQDYTRKSSSLWYFVRSVQREGTGYFVGYDARTKMPIGYLGQKGFRQEPLPEEELFPTNDQTMACVINNRSYEWRAADSLPEVVTPSWLVHLASGDRVMEIDLLNRSTRVVLELEGLLSIGNLEPASPLDAKESEPGWARPVYLAARTREKVLVIDPGRHQRREYLLPERLHDQRVGFFELPDRKAMVTTARPDPSGGTEYRFHWIDDRGNVLRHREVSLGRDVWLRKPSVFSLISVATIPVPAVVTPLGILGTAARWYAAGEEPDFSSAVSRAFGHAWPSLVIVWLLGAVLAWLCHRRQRRYAAAWSWVWIVFVLLFGLPGMVGYLFHRRWPVREPCPACGADVPRDREACVACEKEFPAPELTGTEVLA